VNGGWRGLNDETSPSPGLLAGKKHFNSQYVLSDGYWRPLV